MVRDKLWWYGAYRYTQTSQRYPNLIDEAQDSWNPVYTTKVTYNVNSRHRVIGYHQYTNKSQPDYLFGSTTILKSDALPNSTFYSIPRCVRREQWTTGYGLRRGLSSAPAERPGDLQSPQRQPDGGSDVVRDRGT